MTDREILVGLSGGIAAYKTASLVSELVQKSAHVTVIMTEAAQQFVGATTFAALTGRPVATSLFDPAQQPLGAHIELTRAAELFCVAPATADYLAKMAHGIADDLLSTAYLSFAGPIILAPAMNCHMWNQPAVQRNVRQLRDDGVCLVGPETGWLSCREQGIGRMAAPETILAAIEQRLK